jgi:hypothetical protein
VLQHACLQSSHGQAQLQPCRLLRPLLCQVELQSPHALSPKVELLPPLLLLQDVASG